jgi:energy-coupling factor transport system ATP-binding protein
VVGPSGSGKSTLGLALAGLVPREIPGRWRGSLSIDDRETRSFGSGALAALVGLVFQDPSRQIVMDRVADDAAFGLENRDWPREAMVQRVPEALDAVGLAMDGPRYSRALSGGQQQRLALAGVLAPRPGILVLDEPTASLDPAGIAAFDERLRQIREDRTATIVLVEHRASMAWPLADVVLALGADGRPIAVGSPAEILRIHRPRLAAEGIWLPDEPAVGRYPGSAGPTVDDEVVRMTKVGFAYQRGRPVIEGANLTIRRGERIALIGPNGGGKSTIARLMAGLLRPGVGSVALLGQDPARLSAADLADRVGLVFQRPERQFLTLRVRDEIELGLGTETLPTVEPFMARLGLPLDVFGERSPYGLSGGEQRRLSLATALIRRPPVLILDEPTFGQDRRGFEGLVELLGEQLRAGTTLVVVTHDDRLVDAVASRVVRIGSGTVSGGPS